MKFVPQVFSCNRIVIDKLGHLTESSKVSNFSKEEFEVYQKMHHEKWDHNLMGEAFLEDYADLVNVKVAEGVLDKTREIARDMLAEGDSVEKVARITHLSEDIVRKL